MQESVSKHGSVIIVRVATLEVALPIFAPVVQGVDVTPVTIIVNALLIIIQPRLLEAGEPGKSLLTPGRLAGSLLLTRRAHSVR